MTNHEQEIGTEQVSEFYDSFTQSQRKTGVNLRHYKIVNQVIRYGLQKNHTILEIGCGIGTLTGLLHRYVTRGKVVATDISPRSIELARKNIGKSNRLELHVTDMTNFSTSNRFDFIILPDVMEHIPLNKHADLMRTIVRHMHSESKIVIHIPHPKMIEYLRIHEPSSLQIIDQPVHSDSLLAAAYKNGLILQQHSAYSLFNAQFDYCFITFVLNQDYTTKTNLPKIKIIQKKLVERCKYFFHRVVK